MKLSGRLKWTIVRALVLLVAIGSLASVYYRRTQQQRNRLTAQPDDLTLRVRSIPVTDDLSLGSFDVAPKETHEFRITVDGNRMRNARLAGHFSVQKGPAVQVLLLDENQYLEFQKDSKPVTFDYLSRKTTEGNIDAPMPHAGTYHIVFDNSSEVSASVTVKAAVTIRYETMLVDSGGVKNNK